MELLLPLGLLGLLTIAGLILIYVIKPNYQQKFVSSTFVWKLSLKYNKNKLPINRIKNIIIFLCQLLILALCAVLMAQPVVPTERVEYANETIAVIDASASMMAKSDGETRFERAVAKSKELAASTVKDNGLFSLIVAGDSAYFAFMRSENVDEIFDQLDGLCAHGEGDKPVGCTYASADLDGAALLAEQVLQENPKAEVVLYTATEYIDKGLFKVENVSVGETNVAVLNCYSTLEDNYYTFYAEVGCYGYTAKEVTVHCVVSGYNGTDKDLVVNSKTEYFYEGENTKTIAFSVDDQRQVSEEPVYSYGQVRIYVEEDDSLPQDNAFFLYGGFKPVIKIQYASSLPNKYVRNAVASMRESFKERWTIQFKEIKDGSYATEGYDFYIFEHSAIPEKMPTDGVVLFIDPQSAPEEAGFRVGGYETVPKESTLVAGIQHAVTANLSPEKITVSRYVKILSYDNFDELLYQQTGDPALLLKNTAQEKVAIIAIDLNYSNLAVRIDFPRLFGNLFNYFIPSTFGRTSYEIGDTVNLNAYGDKLTVSKPNSIEKAEFTEFPAELPVTTPGVYTLTHESLRGESIIEQFYVKIANSESNITREVDALPVLNITRKHEREDMDILIYLAAAMVAILFIEWWLQSRSYS